jgi:hypothetical protein
MLALSRAVVIRWSLGSHSVVTATPLRWSVSSHFVLHGVLSGPLSVYAGRAARAGLGEPKACTGSSHDIAIPSSRDVKRRRDLGLEDRQRNAHRIQAFVGRERRIQPQSSESHERLTSTSGTKPRSRSQGSHRCVTPAGAAMSAGQYEGARRQVCGLRLPRDVNEDLHGLFAMLVYEPVGVGVLLEGEVPGVQRGDDHVPG